MAVAVTNRRQLGVSQTRSMQTNTPPLPPDFFDNLRGNRSTTNTIPTTNVTQLSNSIFQVVVNTSSGEETYRLIDINGFFPFTNGSPRPDVLNDAAALLLAIYHFNNIQLSPILTVDDIGDCNIRFTAKLFDTENSPIATTKEFTKVLKRNYSFAMPGPGAIVGADRSSVTSPLAILTGVNNIPQVSYASTSSFFDVKEQYPLFGRTVTNSDGEAAVAVQLFISIGATHVGVLFVTDAYGSALQKSFQDIASDNGLVTSSVAFSSTTNPNGPEIPNAINSLQNTHFRTFYVICYEGHYNAIMTAATDRNIVGNDYLWIFPGFEVPTIFNQLVFPTGSPLIKATAGIGVLVFQGGVVYDSLVPGVPFEPSLRRNSSSGYETFRAAWRQAVNNSYLSSSFRAKIQSDVLKLPVVQFTTETSQLAPLVYDAVFALGISMCRIGGMSSTFSGLQVYGRLTTLDFEGASGSVKFSNQTGTRDFTTLTFQLWNARESETLDENGKRRFMLVPTNFWQNSVWQTLTNQPFIFADGTTIPPTSLPPVAMNFNLIGSSSRVVGYSLMGMVMICSISSTIWFAIYRKERVLRSSQPLFLIMISLGTFIMASAIVPLSLEESFVSQEGLDAACMASPLLYLIGSIMVFSALFAKIRGVYQAYKQPELDFIHVTSCDMLSAFVVLLLINSAIFIPWTIVAPLQWHRILGSANDMFGRKVDSYGSCANEKAWPFGALVFVLNIGVLVFANFRAFVCRNVETEYRESRYVSISLASILQAWCMGVPIAVVVWRNPKARFFVETAIVFITAMAVLMLIYIPKMFSIQMDHILALQQSKKEAYNSFSQRSKRSDHDDNDSKSNGLERHDISCMPQHDVSGFNRASHTASTDAVEEKNEEEAGMDISINSQLEPAQQSMDPACTFQPFVDKESNETSDALVPLEEEKEQVDVPLSTDVKFAPSAVVRPTKRRTLQAERSASMFRLPSRGQSSPALRAMTPSTEKVELGRGIKIVHNPRSERNLLVTNGRELSRQQFSEFLRYADGDDDDEEEYGDVGERDNIARNDSANGDINSLASRNDLAKHDIDQGDLLLDVDDIASASKNSP